MAGEKIAVIEECYPALIKNWTAFTGGSELKSSFECPLFGDAHIPGDIRTGFGPYQVLNGLPGQETFGVVRQLLVLRCDAYGDWNDLPLNTTSEGSYHGGSLEDEVAALLSLMLGVRLKAGSITRLFFPNEDPKGIPFSHNNNAPVLLSVGRKPIVPMALGTHELGDGELTKRIVELPPKDAVALVRSARLFQDGLWLSESDPALSWLLLVSAVETAAYQWREAQEEPEQKLRSSKPDLVAYLESVGGPELVLRIASEFVSIMGSTKKFVDFVLQFRPAPPEVRPHSIYQLAWDNRHLRDVMRQIYNYRSRALHGGIPFPAPMCMPPQDWISTPIPHEIIGHNIGTVGAAWSKDDLPIYLHTFVYIVQGALINWWKEMLASVNTA